MGNYTVIRTDTADALIHKIILDIAEKFGADVALEKLDELEKQIMSLADNPHIGTAPRYMILRRQGYKVLITKKNLVFYKIDEIQKMVIVYAVVDQREDYLNIIRGL
ncbi:MAG: type II toxin-antitoxin system RelE/ParE family toxin [Lachnospiraceae bacterium]|nr:type II toxin-antitoxin system RelE/ParE family toxin [Lachnospiraceae bacterium]